MAKTVPVREFRSRLSELLSDVADRRDHVLVTRNGRPAAALVPIDEYEALEETAEILSDSATLTAIEAGLAELAAIALGPVGHEFDAAEFARVWEEPPQTSSATPNTRRSGTLASCSSISTSPSRTGTQVRSSRRA